MRNIDAIFRQAETIKDLPLRTSAWQSLEAKLDQRNKKRKWRIFSMAASTVIIVSTLSYFIFPSPTYTLEDIDVRTKAMFTTQEINDLYLINYPETYSLDLNG